MASVFVLINDQVFYSPGISIDCNIITAEIDSLPNLLGQRDSYINFQLKSTNEKIDGSKSWGKNWKELYRIEIDCTTLVHAWIENTLTENGYLQIRCWLNCIFFVCKKKTRWRNWHDWAFAHAIL